MLHREDKKACLPRGYGGKHHVQNNKKILGMQQWQNTEDFGPQKQDKVLCEVFKREVQNARALKEMKD